MALSSKFRREVSSDNEAGTPAAPEDSAFAKSWPTLHAFLTETAWEDGSPRETAKISVWCEGGYWKGAINDQDREMSAYTSKTTFKGVLDSLEKGLVNDTLDWRRWTTTTRKGKRG